MVNSKSVVGIKLGDSSVVIGYMYQADEFTHSWMSEHFVAQSYINPELMGKVSTLNHFSPEPGCEDYSFLDQTVGEHGLDSVLTWSIKTLELDVSIDDTDVVTSSVSSGFLCLVNIISDNSKLQLAPSIRSYGHRLGCYSCL